MRIRFWERILAALTGLIVLFIGLCAFVYGAGVFPFKIDLSMLDGPFELWQRVVIVAAAVLLVVLGVHGLSLLFRSRREKGFIMQHTEYGDLSISMHAMENMVKKCIDTHDELKVTGTHIRHTRDGVVVEMRISLANGVNIPLTVSALQKQIKHYITSCSGVDVKEVRVLVETNNSVVKGGEAPLPDLLADDVSAAQRAGSVTESLSQSVAQSVAGDTEEETEAIHQRIFRHTEEPQIVPAPPEAEPAEPEVADEAPDEPNDTDEAAAPEGEASDGEAPETKDGWHEYADKED